MKEEIKKRDGVNLSVVVCMERNEVFPVARNGNSNVSVYRFD